MPTTISLPVTISDINYGDHMGNERFLAFFHEARLAFLKNLNASERDIGGKTGLIMVEASIKYLSQVMHGDFLRITVSTGEVKKTSFTLKYDVYRDQAKVAYGETKLCAFDYTANKISRLPGEFLNSLQADFALSQKT